ncbi:hypothetical protein IFM89_036584 [Coptis chinensis]|uniref:Protein kinase domain-containing protein n=1 Tax=Coptis chinensis TaxID=261450 RepID=A0A835HHT6_9MAGN|nr:hypothetical protein IFM89_036584 [Coptis chinensis]
MTNITYFYNAVRDDDSVSTTSTDNEVSQQQQPNNIVQAAAKAYIGASSVYSAIGNACLSCARPPIELVDDTSLIGTSNSVSPGGSYRKPLTWSLRVSVALDAAKGLSFLHKAGKEVIHGDFKPSNILLDSNYNAKLCDFGLAKDSQTSMIETTYGDTYVRLDSVNDYAAPEYLLEGRLSAKSDVYSFGVVLLEILLGRRIANKNLALRGEAHFTSDLLHKDKLPSLMDRCLEGQYSVRGAQRVAHLALQCINKLPTSRPTMDIVVTTLQTIQDRMSL